jgi:hypothetical protein
MNKRYTFIFHSYRIIFGDADAHSDAEVGVEVVVLNR